MSIDHVAAVLRLGPEVHGTTRMVAFVLAEAANQDTDECWPSNATIRRRAGLRQDRYVVKAIRELEDLGLVVVTVNGAPDERIRKDRRPNLYRMVAALAMTTGVRAAQGRGSRGGATRNERGGATRSDEGARRAPLTGSKEPEGTEPEKNLAAAAATEHDDSCRRMARELAQLAFEQEVKPAIKSERGNAFLAVLGLIDAELRRGQPVALVRAAVEQGVDVWTTDGLRTSIGKAKSHAGRQKVVPTEEAMGTLAGFYESRGAIHPRTATGSALPSGHPGGAER